MSQRDHARLAIRATERAAAKINQRFYLTPVADGRHKSREALMKQIYFFVLAFALAWPCASYGDDYPIESEILVTNDDDQPRVLSFALTHRDGKISGFTIEIQPGVSVMIYCEKPAFNDAGGYTSKFFDNKGRANVSRAPETLSLVTLGEGGWWGIVTGGVTRYASKMRDPRIATHLRFPSFTHVSCEFDAEQTVVRRFEPNHRSSKAGAVSGQAAAIAP